MFNSILWHFRFNKMSTWSKYSEMFRGKQINRNCIDVIINYYKIIIYNDLKEYKPYIEKNYWLNYLIQDPTD